MVSRLLPRAIAISTLAVVAALAVPHSAAAVECAPVTANVRVILGGAYDTTTGLMRDDLRTGTPYGIAVLPSAQPYSTGGFLLRGGEDATADLGDPAVSDADSIVDWVLLELRDATDPTLIIATDAITVQRDGDLSRPAAFSVPDDEYYVAVRHRNHLGVMTAAPVAFSAGAAVEVDFTDPTTDVWDRTDIPGVDYDGAERWITGGVATLWWGDANGDGHVVFQGTDADPDTISGTVLTDPGNVLSSPSYISRQYVPTDVNLDGAAIFQGQNNDADPVYNSVALFPLNTGNDAAYAFHYQQLPASVLGEDRSNGCSVITSPAAPELARTGLDSGTVLAGGIALLVLGVAGVTLVARRSL